MRLYANLTGYGSYILLETGKIVSQSKYLRFQETDAVISLSKRSGHVGGCECVGGLLLGLDCFGDPITILHWDAILLLESVDRRKE